MPWRALSVMIGVLLPTATYAHIHIEQNTAPAGYDHQPMKLVVPHGCGDSPVKEVEKPKKSDMVTKMMKKRLDKQEKKTGVEVVIRKKQ